MQLSAAKQVLRSHRRTRTVIRLVLLPIAVVGLALLSLQSEVAARGIFSLWFCALAAYTILLSVIGVAKRKPVGRSLARTIRLLGTVIWTGFGVLACLLLYYIMTMG